jgi:hypothetical protein
LLLPFGVAWLSSLGIMRSPAFQVSSAVGIAVVSIFVLCGCSSTVRKTVRYPYTTVQARVLEKGGSVLTNSNWQCQLEIDEGSSDGGLTRDHTWIRASEAGTNTTKIEAESVKNVAFTYWQKGRARQRLSEFLEDLK